MYTVYLIDLYGVKGIVMISYTSVDKYRYCSVYKNNTVHFCEVQILRSTFNSTILRCSKLFMQIINNFYGCCSDIAIILYILRGRELNSRKNDGSVTGEYIAICCL